MPVSNGAVNGQLRPSTTSAEKLYQQSDGGVDSSRVDNIHSLVVCNPSASAVTYSVYLDHEGETWDGTTVLYGGVALAAHTTDVLEFGGMLKSPSGSLAVKTDTVDTVVFTLFGTRA